MPTAPRPPAIRLFSPFDMGGDVARRALGNAAQRDHDLAAHVEAAIIVIAVARHVEPVADEDERRRQRQRRRIGARPHDHLAAMGEASARRSEASLLPAGRSGRTRPAGTNCRRRAGLQAERRELGGDVARRDVVAAAAGVAALEQVVGEEGDMGAEGVGAEFGGGRRGRLGDGRGGKRKAARPASKGLTIIGRIPSKRGVPPD